MSIGNFLKNYGIAKSEQVSEGIVAFAAAIDAQGVSEAAIKQKQEEHELLVRQLVDAQHDFEKEQKEFKDIEALYNKRLAAAEKAQADLTADPTNKNAEAALNELLDGIEKLVPKLEKERQEAADAENWLNQLKEASNEVATQLKTLRQQLNDTNQAIKSAELEAERARKERERQEALNGLRKAGNKFDTALQALQQQAEKAQKEAATNRTIADQLRKPAETPVSSAASKYLDEATPTSTETAAERLARLQGKK